MPAGTPKTKTEQVGDEINAIVGHATRYIARDDWQVRQLLHKAEELVQVDPPGGHSLIAAVYQLSGDFAEVRHHSENAIKLAPSSAIWAQNFTTYLNNLGFFSEAQEQFARAANPENGRMTFAWPSGYHCGAFQSMARFLEKAHSMQIDLDGLDVETAVAAATLLDSAGVSETRVAEVLDRVGKIMRDNRIFFLGLGPEVAIWSEAGCNPFIEYVFRFDVSPAIAHAYYLEFVDSLLKESGPLLHDVLSVSFRAWDRGHERSAA